MAKYLSKISLVLITYTLLLGNFVFAEEFPYDTVCYSKMQVSPTLEPSYEMPRCRITKDTLFIDGYIDNAMFYELKYNLAIRHIELNSFGGDAVASREIAELISERKISTNVRKGGKCASACTLLFQAGVKRTIYPTVTFLYHGARLGSAWIKSFQELRDSQGREKSVTFVEMQIDQVRADTAKLFEAYFKYGMNEEFLKKYKSLPESDNWFYLGNFGRTQDLIIGAGELMKYNIIQGFDYREAIE